MPYCVKCGIEIDKKEDKCPLCQTPVYKPLLNDKPPQQKENLERERATVRYIKNRYINISGFCILSVMIILTIINLSINGKISWSFAPLLSLTLLWFMMVFPVKYSDKLNPVIITVVCVMVASAYLLLIDLIGGFLGWSVIVLISSACACFCTALPLLNKRLSVKSVISLTALCIALYLLLLDLILGFTGWSVYTAGGMALLWSFILLPRYIKRNYSTIMIMAFDSGLVLAYLFFVLSANGITERFISFALPLVITVSLPTMLTYIIYKTLKFSIYGTLSVCFFFASLAALAIDKIVNYNIFVLDVIFNQWALITAVCFLIIAIFLFVIEKSQRLREFLNKKLKL